MFYSFLSRQLQGGGRRTLYKALYLSHDNSKNQTFCFNFFYPLHVYFYTVTPEYTRFALSDVNFIRDRLIEIMDHHDRCISQK